MLPTMNGQQLVVALDQQLERIILQVGVGGLVGAEIIHKLASARQTLIESMHSEMQVRMAEEQQAPLMSVGAEILKRGLEGLRCGPGSSLHQQAESAQAAVREEGAQRALEAGEPFVGGDRIHNAIDNLARLRAANHNTAADQLEKGLRDGTMKPTDTGAIVDSQLQEPML